jgi:general nucleoside transport system ATP-binding protein
VMAFCDEVTVLRRGRHAGNGKVAELSPDDMAGMMVGEERGAEQAARSGGQALKAHIEIAGLSAMDNTGAIVVKGLDLVVRTGEIVGIAGVSGNGQSELVEVLAGQRGLVAGSIVIAGKPYHARREQMASLKMFCLPEEPLRNAVVPKMSVAENMAFRRFDKAPYASGGWWLNFAAMRRVAQELITRYRVKTPSPEAEIGTLSGGNVQRAVLARELSGDVDVLIVANPCFGLDFAAVSEIRSQIMAARNRGVAVLLVSEDLDEILELADRIFIMSGGQLVFETPAAGADINAIGRHMAGH